MAEPEGIKPTPNPEAAKPATAGAIDATKYVGTPAVGTSKAAAAAGLSSSGPSNTDTDRRRGRLVWGGGTAFLTAGVPGFFRFFFPSPLVEPHSVFKNGHSFR